MSCNLFGFIGKIVLRAANSVNQKNQSTTETNNNQKKVTSNYMYNQ